ncbi:hypothetical protein B9T62_35875 [Paenibacillus donghaensis]|uniref:Uncharacterized protein n=1 Tax=Paenibacillus donghaensis TaxID=414771 RepID=A0A2Z2KPX6_9BACL|nr:hypothetical protein B9T62_35875 [Paenibacillus donghaensis]
MFNGHGVYRR